MACNSGQNNNSSNVVFVGNIPYNVSQEQIVHICEVIGPVVSFRMVTDKDTGKPKGYGFCEYKDEETALSARRNLQGYDISGRQLRVDFASKGAGGADSNRGGPGFVNAPPIQPASSGIVNAAPHQPTGLGFVNTLHHQPSSVLSSHSGGDGLRNNASNATNDPLTFHLLNRYSAKQLNDILSEMRILAAQNKELANQLLTQYPGLPRAILQAHQLIVNGNQFPMS